jgi:predicted CXXCH cytochrome family protein
MAFAGDPACFNCHKKAIFQGKIVHKPVAEKRCGKCHNPHVAKYEGLLSVKGAEFCYGCHQEAKIKFGKGNIHNPVKKGECGVCHAPHSSNYKRLLRKPLASICLDCHKDAKKKYKVTHKPFANGDCSACHVPHQSNQDNLLKLGEDRLCLSCHGKPDSLKGHQGFPAKVKSCLSCHSPHGSNQKGMMREHLHAPFKKGCKGCHDKKKLDSSLCLSCHPGVRSQAMASHSHLLEGEGNSCNICHSPHASDGNGLLKKKEINLCKSCHGDTIKRMETRLYKHSKTKTCSDCHEAHGANRVAFLKRDGNALCIKCHESQGEFSHPVGDDIVDIRTLQGMTCLTCHDPMGTDFKYHLKLSGQKTLCLQCHRAY